MGLLFSNVAASLLMVDLARLKFDHRLGLSLGHKPQAQFCTKPIQ